MVAAGGWWEAEAAADYWTVEAAACVQPSRDGAHGRKAAAPQQLRAPSVLFSKSAVVMCGMLALQAGGPVPGPETPDKTEATQRRITWQVPLCQREIPSNGVCSRWTVTRSEDWCRPVCRTCCPAGVPRQSFVPRPGCACLRDQLTSAGNGLALKADY